ncbi:F-box protein PP2-B11-like [Impatiens glandulifera]|uniref:F-box protein PP2-B11-like n=1 Tax=Impatiens glandulifera TaxID=253017 RepID=UPI001FB154EA|nr:F-box protein PP2-B11-like [Impatiens glandulifera]
MDLLNKLPENCIAKVISLTSPEDACRISVMGSIFRSAADSDSVWEAFMPSGYRDIIARAAAAPPTSFSSTRDLFFHLADKPLIIDNGTKSFSLEKRTGRKCYMLASRDLSITWSNSPMYWRFRSLPESRFPEVAELIDVCWLEINGKLSTEVLSRNTLYGVYLVFNLTSEAYGMDFDESVEVSCGIMGGAAASETQTVILDRRRRRSSSSSGVGNEPKVRKDGWLEIKMGEYFSLDGEDDDGDLVMSLKEVKRLYWKSGLIVEGIEVRPE